MIDQNQTKEARAKRIADAAKYQRQRHFEFVARELGWTPQDGVEAEAFVKNLNGLS